MLCVKDVIDAPSLVFFSVQWDVVTLLAAAFLYRSPSFVFKHLPVSLCGHKKKAALFVELKMNFVNSLNMVINMKTLNIKIKVTTGLFYEENGDYL